MNKLTFASLAAVLTGLVGSPLPAEARHHDDVAAAVGGFIGGVIVGASIVDHNLPPPPVGVVVSSRHDHRAGHWEWVTVREWVPGRWVYEEHRHRRPTRVWVLGYYDTRRERVWVSHRGHDRCDRR